uniref:RNA helicase n=3 Tax=Cacopsylla melanoneura TaxID=428564 RepID=A0A8D8Y226_9HEMI
MLNKRIMHQLIESPGEIVTGPCAQPEVIICAPTRELVIQIFEVAKKYAYSSILKVCMHYGGASSAHFNRQLERGCHILVATMGRLKDILDKGRISLSSVRFVVLDEADRMLDMGFLGDIQTVMQHSSMPDVSQRHTFMFSATFPETIQKLARQFMRDYLFIAVGIVGGASKEVVQTILEVPKTQKKKKLIELLREKDEDGVIVFVGTIRNADFIACYLSDTEIPTTSIHGSRLQCQREQAIHDFKTKRMKVLVATSVASRGLDIPGIRHVINYDMPKDIDEYVHRIGRTGRVGNKGRATSFYDPEQDRDLVPDLTRILSESDQEVPEFLKSGGGGGSWGSGGGAGFGARDIRHDPNAAPVFTAAEPEESWD